MHVIASPKKPPYSPSKDFLPSSCLPRKNQPQEAVGSSVHMLRKWTSGRNSKCRILFILAQYSTHPVLQQHVRWISTFFFKHMRVSSQDVSTFSSSLPLFRQDLRWLLAGNKREKWPRTGSLNSRGERCFFAVCFLCGDNEREIGNLVCYASTVEEVVPLHE